MSEHVHSVAHGAVGQRCVACGEDVLLREARWMVGWSFIYFALGAVAGAISGIGLAH